METKIKVITNNHPRPVIDASELTAKEREEFEYLDWAAIERGEESASFFRYKGQLYDLGEFTWTAHQHFGIADQTSPLRRWDGYESDSYFSGIVVRYVDDNEAVVVGTFIS